MFLIFLIKMREAGIFFFCRIDRRTAEEILVYNTLQYRKNRRKSNSSSHKFLIKNNIVTDIIANKCSSHYENVRSSLAKKHVDGDPIYFINSSGGWVKPQLGFSFFWGGILFCVFCAVFMFLDFRECDI